MTACAFLVRFLFDYFTTVSKTKATKILKRNDTIITKYDGRTEESVFLGFIHHSLERLPECARKLCATDCPALPYRFKFLLKDHSYMSELFS
jgi:hypothetical protein